MNIFILVLGVLGASNLHQGIQALNDFRAKDALAHLERAAEDGPRSYEDNRLLYEHLGIAFAYLDRKDESLEAFDTLLALDAGYVLSYTLSPKVTFVFAEARKRAQLEQPTEIQVNWPDLVSTDRPLPFTFEVVADRRAVLHKGIFFTRLAGTPAYSHLEFELAPPGQKGGLELPAQASQTTKDEVLEFYFVGLDEQDNEVLRWAGPEHPRALGLKYTAPEAWYQKWWVWALGGSVLAGATGAVVYGSNYEIPTSLNGKVKVPW